jgi:hypothetical protein
MNLQEATNFTTFAAGTFPGGRSQGILGCVAGFSINGGYPQRAEDATGAVLEESLFAEGQGRRSMESI